MENEPKISIPAAFCLIAYSALADLIGFLLIWIGADDFWILDVLTFPVTQFYFRIKGVQGNYALFASLLELIPYLGVLPILTLGVVAVIWADRHQGSGLVQAAKTIRVIQEPEKVLEGKAALTARLAAAKVNAERGGERGAA